MWALDGGGIEYDTARVACAILAGNRWDGWLARRSHDDEGTGYERIERPTDGVTREEVYYFCVSDGFMGMIAFRAYSAGADCLSTLENI